MEKVSFDQKDLTLKGGNIVGLGAKQSLNGGFGWKDFGGKW